MNPTDYMNRFWKEDSLKPFSPNETRLYFFLLSRWTNQGDGKPFECSTHYLETHLLLPKMTITRCREKLMQRGMIQYTKGDRKVKNPFYFLCGVTNDVTNSVTNHVTNDVTKAKEEIPPTPPKEENNIYNNKEISSNEDMKKVKLSSPPPKEKKQLVINYPLLAQNFNEMLSPPLSRCMCITDRRKAAIKARVEEHGIASVITVFQKVHDSSFLTGSNDRNWKCDFDWIFKPTNYIKILEGNYDNGNKSKENLRTPHKPSFDNFNEEEARHVGKVESYEF